MCPETVKAGRSPFVWILLLQPVLFDTIQCQREKGTGCYLVKLLFFKGMTEGPGGE